MATLKNLILSLVKLVHSVREEDLQWKNAHQDQQARLKHARVLAEKALTAELKRKRIQLEHEMTLLRTKNYAELAMYKTKCKQDLKDYKQYLSSLDQLKRSIQASYQHLPEAVAFTIHHHAKHLLNQMWEAENFEQKMQHEIQLIKFMTTVHEEAREHLEGDFSKKLPEKTLALLQQKL